MTLRIAYAFPAYSADFADALENVKLGAPYFDYVVVIEDSSEYHAFSEEQRKQLIEAGKPVEGVSMNDVSNITNVVIRQFPFKDNHPEMYQHGVDAAHDLGADWYAFGDCDEHFNEDFLKGVHQICEGLDKQGVDMAGLICHAQFSIAEGVWPSSLSVDVTNRPEGWMELEKWPERIVITNDHKYMLMKCYPDLKWEGVGRTKTVHTTWNSASHSPWHAAFLPDQFWYLHRKTPLQVFSSAARNMFVSGGGANLGDINTMWVELRKMVREMGYDSWPEFERLVTQKLLNVENPELFDWIKRALTWKATDYGTETRQTALYMIYYYKDLLNDPEIASGVKNPPQVTEDVKVERFVQGKYLEVLGRWPDLNGLERYKRGIMSGEFTQDELAAKLMESPEYSDKRRLLEQEPGAEEVAKVQLPIDVKVSLTEDIIVKIIMQSKTYKNKIVPRMDVGKFLESEIGSDFYKKFYSLRDAGTLDALTFVNLIMVSLPEEVKAKLGTQTSNSVAKIMDVAGQALAT